jgi:hypothetical protein
MASRPRFLTWGPYDDWKEWLRGLAITLLAATFLAYAGAFESGRASMSIRFVYWFGLMILGWLWGALVSRAFFGRIGRPHRMWLRIAVAAVVLAAPYSIVVAFASMWAWRAHFDRPQDIVGLVVSVTAVSAGMITLNVLVSTRGQTTAGPLPPKFLERLPLKLRGAEVWAVEAEDHYLRLHTSKGQDLILMRLSDAIAELEGIEGAQVHRSWWVARGAIAQAVRGDGRATLTLQDGAEVPVSRTYARLLRERGWI